MLGKHSGRNALKQKLAELNIPSDNDETFNDLFTDLKSLQIKNMRYTTRILLDCQTTYNYRVMIFNLNICQLSVTQVKPAAEIILSIKGEDRKSSDGDGAVDAAFNAINKILK